MYGYATDETEEMMPLTIMLAHKMNQLMAKYRRDGTLPWIRPDSKTQVHYRVQWYLDTLLGCVSAIFGTTNDNNMNKVFAEHACPGS